MPARTVKTSGDGLKDIEAPRIDFVRLMASIDDLRRLRTEIDRRDGDAETPGIVERLNRVRGLIDGESLRLPDHFDPVVLIGKRATGEDRRLAALVDAHWDDFLAAEEARLQAWMAGHQTMIRTAEWRRETWSTLSVIGALCGLRVGSFGADPSPARILTGWRTAQSLRSLIDDMTIDSFDDLRPGMNMADAFRTFGGLSWERINAAVAAGTGLAQRIRYVVDLGAANGPLFDLDAMSRIDPWLQRALTMRRPQPLALDFSHLTEMDHQAGRHLAFRLRDHGHTCMNTHPIVMIGDQNWLRDWRTRIVDARVRMMPIDTVDALLAQGLAAAPAP